MKDWKESFRKWALKHVSYSPKKNISKVSILAYMMYKGAIGKESSLELEDVLEKAQICQEIILDEYRKGNFNNLKT